MAKMTTKGIGVTSDEIIRCWDSSTIVHYLAGTNESQSSRLADFVRETEELNQRILVSRLATAEVAHLGNPQDVQTAEIAIRRFFSRDAVFIAELTNPITTLARALVRNFRFKGADAVHVATAITNQVKTLETFDNGMLQRGEFIKHSDTYNLEIQTPQHSGQQGMPNFS